MKKTLTTLFVSFLAFSIIYASNKGDEVEEALVDIMADYVKGEYEKALSSAEKYEKSLKETPEAFEVKILKSKLTAFVHAYRNIEKGLKFKRADLLFQGVKDGEFVDREIMRGETPFKRELPKLRGKAHEILAESQIKEGLYKKADKNFSLCLDSDPVNKRCTDWFEQKGEMVKKLYTRAINTKRYNPAKAKALFEDITEIVTWDNEYHKKAKEQLKRMSSGK